MDKESTRLDRNRAILMVCDIQQKFMPLVYGREGVIQASCMAIRTARILGIPILVTEHVKKTMGNTSPELMKHLDEKKDHFVTKTKFSMCFSGTEAILEKYPERKQIMLIGAQTQVCVLQTFLDLKSKGYQVFLLADAITSIRSWQRHIAFQRMEKQGAIITTYQSSAFDLLKDSKDEKFKAIISIIKQTKRTQAISHL